MYDGLKRPKTKHLPMNPIELTLASKVNSTIRIFVSNCLSSSREDIGKFDQLCKCSCHNADRLMGNAALPCSNFQTLKSVHMLSSQCKYQCVPMCRVCNNQSGAKLAQGAEFVEQHLIHHRQASYFSANALAQLKTQMNAQICRAILINHL